MTAALCDREPQPQPGRRLSDLHVQLYAVTCVQSIVAIHV